MIKNFIYLDEDKMYSLSSQVFEGITEYVLSESGETSEESESQKGPVGSGRVVGDILRISQRISERKYLHDHSYTLFEKHLEDEKKVCSVYDRTCLSDIEENLEKFSFFKIKSQATFNDINSINRTLKDFNRIGQALTRVRSQKNIGEVESELEKTKSAIGDRNKKAKLQQQLKALTNVERLAKESGLHQDQKFLDDLSFLLNYGFQEQLEMQLELNGRLFSANLKREYLREGEELIIRKYARKTEKDFVLFGAVTQATGVGRTKTEIEETPSSIKKAIMGLVASLSEVEAGYTGRLSNEIIIDPIAVYTEL